MQPIRQVPVVQNIPPANRGNASEAGLGHIINTMGVEEVSDTLYLAISHMNQFAGFTTLEITIDAIHDIQRSIDVDEKSIPESPNITKVVYDLNGIFPTFGNLFFNAVVHFAKSSSIRSYFPGEGQRDQIAELIAALQRGHFTACIRRDFGGNFAVVLAESIFQQKLGTDNHVLQDISVFIRHIQWINPMSQQCLAAAICHQKFYINDDVLKELAISIGKIEWTDPRALQFLAEAIANQSFGTNPDVLKELSLAIRAISWIDPLSQQYLISSIETQKFGTNTDTLKELAASIGNIHWTDQGALQHLAKSILDQKFGTNDAAFEELAVSIGNIPWTDLLSQQFLSAAIYHQKFGTNDTVLKELAESVGIIRWTDQGAQQHLTFAIRDQKFGTDRDTLITLAVSSLKIPWNRNNLNQIINIFIAEIASLYFHDHPALKHALDFIRQRHFNNMNIEKFVSEQNHAVLWNATYAHKLREPSTMQELRLFFETHNDIFDGYKEAIQNFQTAFEIAGLVNDQDDPDERIEERFFLYKNPRINRFCFLNITGDLIGDVAAIDPINPDFDTIFNPDFVDKISNGTIALYSLNETEIEQFQVENKDHLMHFPLFMHGILHQYHNKNDTNLKIRLQSLIQDKMMSSMDFAESSGISDAEKAELRGITVLAFSDPRISSASQNTDLKRAYDHALTMKFLGESEQPEEADQAFQVALEEILDFCQTSFDKETDTQNYIDVLLFSSFMFGHLSSAYVFGWHTGGAHAENASNTVFRKLSVMLFEKLNEEINTYRDHLLTNDFLTQNNMDVLESIVRDIHNTARGRDTEGVGICIGQIMANISSNPGLYGHIERFFL